MVKPKLTSDERALLQLSKRTLKSLEGWPRSRESWLAHIEAGGRFWPWPAGEDSMRGFRMTDDIYEKAKANVERLTAEEKVESAGGGDVGEQGHAGIVPSSDD